MSSNFKLGEYTIKSMEGFNALVSKGVKSESALKKLDSNKDKVLTEDELVDYLPEEEKEETPEQNLTLTEQYEKTMKETEEKYEGQLKSLYQEMDSLEEAKSRYTNKVGTAKDLEALNSYLESMDNIESQLSGIRNQIVTLASSYEDCVSNLEANYKKAMEQEAAQYASASPVTSSGGEINLNTSSDPVTTPQFSYNFTEKLSARQQGELSSFKQNWQKNQSRYQAVAEKTGVPAQLIAAIHWRESGGNFSRRLQDGGSLGNFSNWEESAIYILKDRASSLNVNDINSWYDFAENYNGLGYRKKGVASPYVWAGTSNYSSGKYVADGVYDAGYVDQQLGVAVMLKSLMG